MINNRSLLYYVVMYRRAVLVCLVLSITMTMMALVILYLHMETPERKIYASEPYARITRLFPIRN